MSKPKKAKSSKKALFAKKELSSLEYLSYSKFDRAVYKFMRFIYGIPRWFKKVGLGIGRFFKKIGLGIAHEFKDIFLTFKNGDYKTRLSYVVMGFGNMSRGQIGRGILFLGFETIFIVYMITFGGKMISMLPSLGVTEPIPNGYYDEALDAWTTKYGDNSFQILLYGVLTIFFIIAFIYTWRLNIKQNKIAQEIIASGKPLKSGKDDIKSLIDDQFHKTLLALPVTGILIFTVMPIVFMVLVAFTNYDGAHNGYSNALFHWQGFDNFNTLLNWSGGNSAYSATFGEVLAWTLMWAFFATFSNYFLGMLVAIMINKKGIKYKKLWRTVLVLTIAIPQFISLLYVSKMFAKNGLINGFLGQFGVGTIDFFGEKWSARWTVIIINIWIGIPYLMLVTTGILMNIPADLYESASIDGANVFQQYTKITLPYMLFITGPYLLTSFTGNMNNFNVIFLLTGGAPHPQELEAGQTDLLVTWLFQLTMKDNSYSLGAVLGIIVFIVVALISLIVYNILPSTKNEEAFQ